MKIKEFIKIYNMKQLKLYVQGTNNYGRRQH